MVLALFDGAAASYDQWYETPAGRLVDAIEKDLVLAAAAPRAGEIALDLGCGTGNYSLWLAEMGLAVTALDLSAGMLERARAKAAASAAGLERVRFVQGNFADLPFADASFDLVLSVTALEFAGDPSGVLKEALRVTRPGGRVVAAVLTRPSPWAEKYEAAARHDPGSVFARAHLFETGELPALVPGLKPEGLLLGLYVGPEEAARLTPEEAWGKERAGRAAGWPGAAFAVARWPKPQPLLKGKEESK